MVLLIYLYLAVAFLVAVIAMMRGRIGWRWFIAAVLLTPLIAGLMLIALPRVRPLQPGLAKRGPNMPLQVIPMPADSRIRVIRQTGPDERRAPCVILINGAQAGAVNPDTVVEFRVPSGQLRVEARMARAESRPLTIRTAPGIRIDLEITHQGGSVLAFWSKLFPTDTYLALRRLPAGDRAA